MGSDKNYVSVGGWLVLFFVTAFPCLGPVVLLILAFTDKNETRRNYCRAMVLLYAILLFFGLVVTMLGWLPAIVHHLKGLRH